MDSASRRRAAVTPDERLFLQDVHLYMKDERLFLQDVHLYHFSTSATGFAGCSMPVAQRPIVHLIKTALEVMTSYMVDILVTQQSMQLSGSTCYIVQNDHDGNLELD